MRAFKQLLSFEFFCCNVCWYLDPLGGARILKILKEKEELPRPHLKTGLPKVRFLPFGFLGIWALFGWGSLRRSLGQDVFAACQRSLARNACSNLSDFQLSTESRTKWSFRTCQLAVFAKSRPQVRLKPLLLGFFNFFHANKCSASKQQV